MTAPYTIHSFDESAKVKWDDFVESCPEATFFHRAGWQSVIAKVFCHRTHNLYAEHAGKVVGVLPLVEVKSTLFGHAMISNGFSVCGGPAVTHEPARLLLNARAEEIMLSSGAAYLEYRSPATLNEAWATRDNLYASFSGLLPPNEDENLKQIPRKQRAVVRKAIGSDLTFTIDDNTEQLYDLYAISVRNLGTPVFSRAYFSGLLEEFSPHCDVLTVSAAGKPVASVLSFYFRNQVVPFYTGSLPEARRLGANDLMYWRLMRHAAAKGCTEFNFGRSKVGTGPYDFKKNWGFLPQPIAHQFLLRPGVTMPDINPLNAKYRLMIALWKRLPLPVANILGPLIVRNIA